MEYIGQFEDVFQSYMRIHYGAQQKVPDTAAALESFIREQRLTQQQAAQMREVFAQKKSEQNRLTMYVTAAGVGLVILLSLWRFSK